MLSCWSCPGERFESSPRRAWSKGLAASSAQHCLTTLCQHQLPTAFVTYVSTIRITQVRAALPLFRGYLTRPVTESANSRGRTRVPQASHLCAAGLAAPAGARTCTREAYDILCDISGAQIGALDKSSSTSAFAASRRRSAISLYKDCDDVDDESACGLAVSGFGLEVVEHREVTGDFVRPGDLDRGCRRF